jgi:hypothetical protein
VPFDPDSLKQHARKGNFGLKTQPNEIKDTAQNILRAQQDLLVTQLHRTLRQKPNTFTLPRLFSITGKQAVLYNEALASLNINAQLDPSRTYRLDKSGFCADLVLEHEFPTDYLGQNFVICSLAQADASLINDRFSFLDSLLTTVQQEYASTIGSFTRAEAVIGTVGNSITELGIERFLREQAYEQPGAVDVGVSIRTPTDAITKLRTLANGIKEIVSTPETLTGRREELYDLSVQLKTKHKKLSDLQLPANDSSVYAMSSFWYGDSQIEMFYFKKGKPLFIVFAQEDMEDIFDNEFIILNGNNRSRLINNMMDLQFIDYLVEFAETVRDSYAPASRGILAGLKSLAGKSSSNLPAEWHALNDVVTTLRCAEVPQVIAKIPPEYEFHGNSKDLENVRGQYIRSLDADLKSRIIFPKSEKEDKLVCDLISRCNPSEAMRNYRSTNTFIEYFAQLDEPGRIETLRTINSTMRFESQNNPLANMWLQSKYADTCKAAGIKFAE